MRTTVLVLLSTTWSFAQVGWANWKYVDRELFWSNVYTTDSLGVQELTRRAQAYLTSKSYASNIKAESGKVTADIRGMIVDYKKYRLQDTYLHRPIKEGYWYGRVLYELKDNRYRVTFSSATVDLGQYSGAGAVPVGGAIVGGAATKSNQQTASEIYVSSDEKEIVNKEGIFTFHQFLLNELELKKGVVARGDF